MRAGIIVCAAACLVLVASAPAGAQLPPLPELESAVPISPGVKRLKFSYGPLVAGPGQNLILAGPVTIEKPLYDGYVVGVRPNVVRADGKPPPVEVVHMHHAVFLNLSRRDPTASGLPERFYAFAEEKTEGRFPEGYGYPVKASDVWAINYMLHNGTASPETVWITYEVDYVAANSALGRQIKAARPLWLDVENGKAYPVFDVQQGSGARGRFTYPDDAVGAYRGGRPRNEWTVDRAGTLIATAGHVHPGGLWTDLRVRRGDKSRRVFRSKANYFDPNGPVSWDMAMDFTPERWRVGVRKGDVLRVDATYETELASWYESMGIMVVFMADGEEGPDPFERDVDLEGEPTHGHLPEAGNHGGDPTGLNDPSELPEGSTIDNRVGVAGFQYLPGDAGGGFRAPPTVDPGQSLNFGNLDAAAQVPHTVTTCRPPCNRSTGISFPLADGKAQLDSGQLAYGPEGFTAAAQRAEWRTPRNLKPGTYTYFCRIHPFMRGSFRVRGPGERKEGERIRRVSVSDRPVRLTPLGRARIRVRCADGDGPCSGRLQVLRRRPGRRGRAGRLGSSGFRVEAGRAELVAVRVPRSIRRLVAGRGRLRTAALADAAADGADVARVVLRPPGPSRR